MRGASTEEGLGTEAITPDALPIPSPTVQIQMRNSCKAHVYALTRRWEDGFLDPALIAGTVRIAPHFVVSAPLREAQFFDRGFDPWMVWNYWQELGTRDVVRKVRSRTAERARNHRYFLYGTGLVLDSLVPEVSPGSEVAFVAPNSPQLLERLILPGGLVKTVKPCVRQRDTNEVWLYAKESHTDLPSSLTDLGSWNEFSGVPIPPTVSDALAGIPERIERMWPSRKWRAFAASTPVKEHTDTAANEGTVGRRPQATVFGRGNYVKTMVVPEMARHVDVSCVHEIDPLQIGRRPDPAIRWDTSPWFRDDEIPEIVVIAGYHSMHASLAADALDRGTRAVVIEKPIATTGDDLRRLLASARRTDASLFVAFQRRYSSFNEVIRRPVGGRPSGAISCAAIAYEVPLPSRHWYRWPTSGSRLISNGCHWLDHFLFINDYSTCEHLAVAPLGDTTIVVTATLANGANLSFTLTDEGSPRLGVRDHCEFRSGNQTVVIDDFSRLVAEDSHRRVARLQTHRLEAHRTMYRSIGHRISSGGPGDDLDQLRQSAEFVLAAEALYQEATGEVTK